MKNLIIKLLARIGFKEAIQSYVQQHQSKDYRENMRFAFTDSAGRKYYSFPDLKDLPLPLLEKLNELQEQLACKLPGRDFDRLLEKMEEVLNGNSPSKLTDLGYWIGTAKARRSILFDPTILTEIAALLYIREDENPSVYNEALHKEKFEMLWSDSRNGNKLYDFFQAAGLNRYIPSQSISAENWQQSLKQMLEKIAEFDSALSSSVIRTSMFVSGSEK